MVVVKNLTAASITIAKDVKVTQVVAVNAVPLVELTSKTMRKSDEIQLIQQNTAYPAELDDGWTEEEISLSAAGFMTSFPWNLESLAVWT